MRCVPHGNPGTLGGAVRIGLIALFLSAAPAICFADPPGTAPPGVDPTGRPLPVVRRRLPPVEEPSLPHPAPPGTKMPPIPDVLVSPPARRHLTLSEAVDMALAHNPQIGQQLKVVEAARLSVNLQYSGYYPTVSVNASQSHSESQNTVFINGQATSAASVGGQSVSVTTKIDNASTQLSASQTLLDFGRRRWGVLAAVANLEASIQDLEKLKQDIALTVRTAFFNAFVDQVLVDINRQTVAQYEEHLRQSEGFYETGVRALSEVTKARSDLAAAQLNLVKAVGTLRGAWVILNVSMGLARDMTFELELQRPETLKVLYEPERLVDIAISHRPELVNLQMKIRAQIATMQQSYANRLPTISANAGYGWAGSPSPLDQAWNVSVQLTWTLFNGFFDHYTASIARANAEALLYQWETQRQTVFQQVETDYFNLEQSRAAIEAARVSLENAQENYRLARERYQVGLGSNLELADAQGLLAQAQQALAMAQSTYQTSRAQLEHDMGVYDLDALPPTVPHVAPDRIPGSHMRVPGSVEVSPPGTPLPPGVAPHTPGAPTVRPPAQDPDSLPGLPTPTPGETPAPAALPPVDATPPTTPHRPVPQTPPSHGTAPASVREQVPLARRPHDGFATLPASQGAAAPFRNPATETDSAS